MASESPFPKVSVIIPAHNEAECVARTVRAIKDQETETCAVEVIVVDDASTDDTVRIAKDAGANVIEMGGAGGNPAAARNRGASAAEGDPLIFLDADCQVADGWLHAFLEAHKAGETIVAGSLDLPEGLSFTAQCDYYFGWYMVHPHQSARHVPHSPAPNLSVRRDAFFATSRFEELPFSIASEERAWQAELRNQGHRIYFEPHARALHYNRSGFWNLLKRSYRWGYASIRAKNESGTAQFAGLYQYPRLMIAMALPLAFVHSAFILSRWVRVGIYRPLLMLPLLVASRLTYSVAMMIGGVRWLRHRNMT
ncbi:MAG: glycosyltransferase [Gammaproteobacteria bacterium]|nr:glycosyltransferase [Gammaproteobacteria bacterium]NNL50927.1 glycosyltransferase [Woeseiaceae bacterium]